MPIPGLWALSDLDPLIKSDSQRVQRDHTDKLNAQQLELWPDA